MLRHTARTRVVTAVAALALAAPVAAATVPAATAAPAECTTSVSPDYDSVLDVDGDGTPEWVFPIPAAHGSAERIGGVVQIREYGTKASSDQVLHRPAGDGARRAADRFGAAAARAYLDEPNPSDAGCTDLVVGAPGVGGSGRVYVIFGSPAGPGAGRTSLTIAPAGLAAGDQFGSAVTVLDDRTLRIGAPGTDLPGAIDAGAVYDITLVGYGEDTQIGTITRITRATTGVPGAVASGDRFGSVLAPHGAVGIPSDDIGKKLDAGSVWTGRFGDGLITQDSPGVPGGVEAGDRFGAAVDDRHGILSIGAPGEDVGKKRHDAGALSVVIPRPTVNLQPVSSAFTFTQDTRRIPGKAETGDRFGSSVAAVETIECRYFWAGAPGEDLGKKRDAGTATRIAIRTKTGPLSTGCKAVPQGERFGLWASSINQDSAGIPGKPESGDRFGASFGVRAITLEDGTFDRVYFGVPGEDVGELTDVGAWSGFATPKGATSGEQVGTVPMLL